MSGRPNGFVEQLLRHRSRGGPEGPPGHAVTDAMLTAARSTSSPTIRNWVATAPNIEAEFGNYGLVHLNGAANVAIGSDSALRASFNVIRRDGYLSDGTNDECGVGRTRSLQVPTERRLNHLVQYGLRRTSAAAGVAQCGLPAATRRRPQGSNHGRLSRMSIYTHFPLRPSW